MLGKILSKSPARFLIFAGLFLTARIVFLLFAHPVSLYTFRMEELYRGAMALELIKGSLETFYRYRPDDYAGGSFVIGGLASLLFRFFPANALTLKMVSVLWSGGVLWVWYRAVAAFTDKKKADLFALLFIFCPPAFLRYTLAPLGDHAETLLFAGAELWILSALIGKRKENPVLSAVLGLIAGFGVWFAYIHVFAVLSVLIFWRCSEPHLFRKKCFWIFGAAFLAGFSPWIVMNLKDFGIGLMVQGQPLWHGIHIKNFAKRVLNFRESAPYLLFSYFDLFEPPYSASKFTIWFYRLLFLLPLGGFLISWLTSKKRRYDWKAHPLLSISLIYLVLFSVTVQFTEYTAVRYWIPAQPFLFILLLFCFDFFSEKRFLIPAFLTVWITGTLISTAALLTFSEKGYAVREPGYSHAWLTGAPACSNSKSCLSAYRYFRERLTEDEKRSLVLDLSLSVASDLSFDDLPAALDRAESELPPETLRMFYYALGYEIFTRNQQSFEKSLAFVNSQIKPRSETFYRLCLWGVMDVGMNQFEPVSPQEMTRLQSAIPEFAVREYWRKRGFEWMQALLHTSKPKGPLHSEIDAVLRHLKLENYSAFVQGIGLGLYGHWRINQKSGYVRPQDFDSLLPRIQRAMAEGGGIGSSKLPSWDQLVMKEMFFRTVPDHFRGDFEKSRRYRDLELDALGYSF